jgi:D-alanyl-D-alanine carboxypeptidase
MGETSLPSDPALPEPFSRGYSVDPSAPTGATPSTDEPAITGVPLIDWTAFNPTAAWAAGGVVSTVSDLRVWLQALINGSLVSPELRREQLDMQPVERDPGEPPFGYGLGIADDDGVIGHDGSILGYHSYIGVVRETGTAVIVLANLDPAKDRRDSATEIARALIQRLPAAS